MTAVVTAAHLVSGLAARISNGVDANYPGDNKLLKDAMVAKNFFTASSGGTAGVGSFNGRTGDVILTAADVSSVYPIKTVNGQALTGTGDITITSGVGSINGKTGAITLKTINGQALDGTGDITITSGISSFNTRTGAVTLTAADVSSVYPLKTINGQTLIGAGDITITSGGTTTGLTAGSTSVGFINYSGTTPTDGQWSGNQTTLPVGDIRLNYNGRLVSNKSITNAWASVLDPTVPTLILAASDPDYPSNNGMFHYNVSTKTANVGSVGTGTITSIVAGGAPDGSGRGTVVPIATASLNEFKIETGKTFTLSTTSKLQVGTSAGTSGQVLTSTGTGVTWSTISTSGGVTSVNGKTGAVTLKTINGQALDGTGNIAINTGVSSFNTRTGAVTLTAADVSSVYPIKTVNGQTLTGTGNVTISATVTGLSAGSTSTGFINYSGTTKTGGQWYSSTTMPTGTTRLNFDGVLAGSKSASNTFFEVVDPSVASILLVNAYHSDPVSTSSHNGVFNYYMGTKHAQVGAYGIGTKLSLIAGGSGSGGAVFRAATISDTQFEIAVPTLIGYTTSQSSAYRLQVNSQIFATSSTIATSDRRYKTNVASLTGALTLVNKLNPVQFDWIKHPVHEFPEGKTLGFIAQEVAEVLSETDYVNSVVKANNCELPDGTSEEFLGIAEGNLIALLTAAVKELTGQVQVLTARVQQLELGTL